MAAPWQVLDNTLGEAKVWSQNLDAFLRVQDELPSQITKRLKSIYDLTKSIEKTSSSSSTLPELFVDSFDDEQVWQQLELQNSSSFRDLLSQVAKILAGQTSLTFSLETLSQESCKESNKSREKVQKAETCVGFDSDSNIDSDEVNNNDDDLGGNDVEDDQDDEEKTSGSEGDLSDDTDDKFGNDTDDKFGNDTDDKFDKFGSDSDEDLNFDFAAVGEGEDELEGSEDELEASDNDENRQSDEDNNLSEKRKLQTTLKSDDKSKRSIVDDQFFKLADLENFLDKEDAKWDKKQRREKMGLDQEESESDSEDIDMFQDIPSDDEEDGRKLRYEDFFDPPETETTVPKSTKKVRFDDRLAGSEDEEGGKPSEDVLSNLRKGRRDLLGDSESEGEDVEDVLGGGKKLETKSSFEKRQEKLTKRISKMEEDLLSEKPWQMAGEVGASHRPENSLLEENLQFEHNTRLPPEITEETTMKLEDIIKQRIKDKVWDDVERKVKHKEDVFEYKKRITLDQEKSKLSLGEIYEQEYLKQQQKESEDKEDPDHEEIKKMMQSLFIKLDSLSNFHYTPKMFYEYIPVQQDHAYTMMIKPAPEVKIVSNLPSITMEEVAPISASEAKILAPEEVQEKTKGELKGATEKTDTDKKRERKKKKTEKRIKNKEKEKRQKLVEKLNPGLGNKYSKENALKKLDKESKSKDGNVTLIKSDKKEKTGLTSSSSFFSQLQEQVTSQIQSQKVDKRKKDQKRQKSSKKLKL